MGRRTASNGAGRPGVETHAPLVAFDTFANLLASILWGTNDDLAGIYDGSTLWRESIAHDRGLFVGRRNELVTAVRTMAVAAVRAGVATAMEIVTRLRERKLAIFERLALFTLAQFPAEAPDLVASELLSDLDRLRDDFDRREFGMLVAAGFPHLAPDDQWRVVKLICSGPDVERFVSVPSLEGSSLPKHISNDMCCSGRRDSLRPFSNTHLQNSETNTHRGKRSSLMWWRPWSRHPRFGRSINSARCEPRVSSRTFARSNRRSDRSTRDSTSDAIYNNSWLQLRRTTRTFRWRSAISSRT
jgi:hypothetical protein